MRPIFPSSPSLWRQRPQLLVSSSCLRKRIHLWSHLRGLTHESQDGDTLKDYRELTWPDFKKNKLHLFHGETNEEIGRIPLQNVRVQRIRAGRMIVAGEDPFGEVKRMSGQPYIPTYHLVEVLPKPPVEILRKACLEIHLPIDISPTDLRERLSTAYHFLSNPYTASNYPVEFHIHSPPAEGAAPPAEGAAPHLRDKPLKKAMSTRLDLSPRLIRTSMPTETITLTGPWVNAAATDVVWLLARKKCTVDEYSGAKLAKMIARAIKKEHKPGRIVGVNT